jgi:hypothetical protein
MRLRFIPIWAALALLVMVSGAWAQCRPVISQQDLATLRQQAASGKAEAQCSLGFMYYTGIGVPQDFTQAALWMTKAAEQGNAPAEAVLGDLYYLGEGVPKDFSQAAYWDRKAADAGIIHAKFSLGVMYSNGYGVPQDKAQAAVWYRKAAEQGYASAQLSLGSLYVLGQGVPQDYAEAYFWMDLAAAGKIHEVKQEDVAKMRDNAASHLTPADLSRVQERARKWFEDHPAKTPAQ